MELVSNKEAVEVTVETLIQTAEIYKYAGKFLLESQCQGYEAQKHHDAVTLLTANFMDLDKQIVAHPGFPAWAKEQEKKKAEHEAAVAAAKK